MSEHAKRPAKGGAAGDADDGGPRRATTLDAEVDAPVADRAAPPSPPEAPVSEQKPLSEQEPHTGWIVDGEEHQVDPRAVTVSRFVGMASILAVSLAPLLGVTLGWALGSIPSYLYLPLLFGGIALLSAAQMWAYKWPELHHRHLRYRVDEAGMRIRRGVLWRKVISIPTSRVQHTDVSQGPVQRQYGLATLTVYTAGTEGASISLAGLEESLARRLRDHLLPDHVTDDA